MVVRLIALAYHTLHVNSNHYRYSTLRLRPALCIVQDRLLVIVMLNAVKHPFNACRNKLDVITLGGILLTGCILFLFCVICIILKCR